MKSKFKSKQVSRDKQKSDKTAQRKKLPYNCAINFQTSTLEMF